MTKKVLFAEWLEINRNISQNSIEKYTRSIDIIGSELESYGLQETELYNISNTEFIDLILLAPTFIEKDERGHRMYSVALNHFRNFIENYYDNK